MFGSWDLPASACRLTLRATSFGEVSPKRADSRGAKAENLGIHAFFGTNVRNRRGLSTVIRRIASTGIPAFIISGTARMNGLA